MSLIQEMRVQPKLFTATLIALSLFITSHSRAKPVTFAFEARTTFSLQPYFPFPVGQRASGTYTFDSDTPPTVHPRSDISGHYADAVIDFNVTIEGYGTGHGSNGTIGVGKRFFTGDLDFVTDSYSVNSVNATGIAIPGTILGTTRLSGARIWLDDIDQSSIHSVELPLTPPSLTPFLDNQLSSGVDRADLVLVFSGGRGAIFQLESLTLVPEPSAGGIAILLFFLFTGNWRATRRAQPGATPHAQRDV